MCEPISWIEKEGELFSISFERTYKPEDNAKITIRFYYLKEHAQCE